MSRFFGGPGNFEQRYRDAEAETYGDLCKQGQHKADQSYLLAYLAIVAIIFVSFCIFWRFA